MLPKVNKLGRKSAQGSISGFHPRACGYYQHFLWTNDHRSLSIPHSSLSIEMEKGTSSEVQKGGTKKGGAETMTGVFGNETETNAEPKPLVVSWS